jgi:ribosomal protein S18 acetylase RimI-like enzyme
MTAMVDPHPLDNPVYASLAGPHAHFAERHGHAVRYPEDVATFVALRRPEDDWSDLAALAGAGRVVALAGVDRAPPGWEVVQTIPGVQLVDAGVAAAADPDAVRLGPTDVPAMLDLVARTRPGPFLGRTAELGTFLGIRDRGRLIAMAGERLHPPGWTEISAVCTDPAYQGRGLAGRLVRAVAAGIHARGETPFLHAATSNTNAIRRYGTLGFALRRSMTFLVLRVPRDAV